MIKLDNEYCVVVSLKKAFFSRRGRGYEGLQPYTKSIYIYIRRKHVFKNGKIPW